MTAIVSGSDSSQALIFYRIANKNLLWETQTSLLVMVRFNYERPIWVESCLSLLLTERPLSV
jgi:hypothetical protein